ncbi:MAG: tryptophan synthase subunit alpha [Actinomycetota bacterium]|nr:tryptophan synthase subunit alpha [Actinomycetota bacterium]
MSTLAVYLVCTPDVVDLAEAAAEGGADLVELGFPFSDPLADGPIIRVASARALSEGMRTARCLEALAEIRERVDLPLVPMTYAAILEAYGPERFATDVRDAGATSMIVADLPIDVAPELGRIHLVAPTTSEERLAAAGSTTDGWLYLVTRTGVTGPREDVGRDLPFLAARARSVTAAPLYAGFGIGRPEQAVEALEHADGVVVGSAAVEVAQDLGPAGLREFVGAIRTTIDAAAPVRRPA